VANLGVLVGDGNGKTRGFDRGGGFGNSSDRDAGAIQIAVAFVSRSIINEPISAISFIVIK